MHSLADGDSLSPLRAAMQVSTPGLRVKGLSPDRTQPGGSLLWGLNAHGASRPCLGGPPFANARLVTNGPSHRRACVSGYTDLGKGTGPWECSRALLVFLVELLTFVTRACDERRMWIACRWLNPSVK